ncbi:MAG TPA: hypothetical protein VIL49_18115, partial [Capillimicrobium sp.]
MSRPRLLAVAAVALAAVTAGPAAAAPYGSGSFGHWRTGPFDLPAYRYTVDQERDPRARQPELDGRTDAWHQLGNDHIVANAYTDGTVALWSQDRRYQWVNRRDPAAGRVAGGFGYLRVGGRTISTRYVDRPPGARTERDFGAGYARKRLRAAGLDVVEHVYAPFGDDPVLLHDVEIRNLGPRARRVSWFELWDVNPYDQGTKRQRGLHAPRWSAATRTVTVAQTREQLGTRLAPDIGLDARPLTIFGAALRGPDGGHATDAAAFLGDGTFAAPAAVAADRLDPRPAPAVAPGAPSATVVAFRAPLRLAAGERVTLRYAFGAAQPQEIPEIVRRQRAAADPLRATQRAWARWLPDAELGDREWLRRELRWSAYMVRSGATYEECRGRRVISQGGYYQYDNAGQMAYRDPLQHLLPMIYADPALARDVLLYSAQELPRGADSYIPYGMGAQCQKIELGFATDLDLWLLLAAAEYGLATRDLRAFDTRTRFADGGTGSLWDHLRVAFRHQESLLRPSGAYDAGTAGDWSDLSPQFLGMTESLLIPAQTAYVYPRLAELAELRGDEAFARELRAAGERDLATTRRAWTGRWYARGYAGDRLLGTGAIFGEQQPWAMLSGAPTDAQAATLVANIRRFLTGIGAPGGPSRTGSSQSPAADDPEVTETSLLPGGVGGGGNAVFVGGSWFAINGWLTWGMAGLDVPGARRFACDELQRNTLAAHATAFPDHWNGTISVDDVCSSFYQPDPASCGNGIQKTYAGQVMHQPAWLLFATLKLAGVEPTRDGYTIDPRLPMQRFALRLPRVAVRATGGGALSGSITPTGGGALTLRVAAPGRRATVDGRAVRVRRDGRFAVLRATARPGRPLRWSV